MSDPFLPSSLEPSSSQEVSSQSSVQSFLDSFFEVSDSNSYSQVSQSSSSEFQVSQSSSSELSFPLANDQIFVLDILPAPHRHIEEENLPAILTESLLEVLEQSPSVTPRGLRQGISLLSNGTLVSKISNPEIILYLKQTQESVSLFGEFCGQCVGGTGNATEEARLLISSTYFHQTGE